VRVSQADSQVVQAASLDHEAQFAGSRHANLREKIEQRKRIDAVLQRP